MQQYAEFTWPFMKQITYLSEKEYCHHVSVIEYVLYAEKGKAVMKGTNEISKMVGVSKRTLQYYDDEGIINVSRSENNYRLYDQKTLEQLWEIMIYKEMGLKLKEIKQILLMSEDEKKEYLGLRIKELEKRISVLKEQDKFISLIMTDGIPPIPEENAGVTYKSKIAEIKKKCVHE